MRFWLSGKREMDIFHHLNTNWQLEAFGERRMAKTAGAAFFLMLLVLFSYSIDKLMMSIPITVKNNSTTDRTLLDSCFKSDSQEH